MARVLTLLVADDFRREESGKMTAVGLHFNVRLPAIDAEQVGKVVFVTLTDLPAGEHKASVRFVNTDLGIANEADGSLIRSSGEIDILTLVIKLSDFRFPASGMFNIEFLINDEVEFTQIISVKYDEEPPHDFENDSEDDER